MTQEHERAISKLTTENERLRAILDEMIAWYESDDCLEVHLALALMIEEAAKFRKQP